VLVLNDPAVRSGHIRVQEVNSYHAWGDVPLSAPTNPVAVVAALNGRS